LKSKRQQSIGLQLHTKHQHIFLSFFVAKMHIRCCWKCVTFQLLSWHSCDQHPKFEQLVCCYLLVLPWPWYEDFWPLKCWSNHISDVLRHLESLLIFVDHVSTLIHTLTTQNLPKPSQQLYPQRKLSTFSRIKKWKKDIILANLTLFLWTCHWLLKPEHVVVASVARMHAYSFANFVVCNSTWCHQQLYCHSFLYALLFST
jgi:hypothetical protein